VAALDEELLDLEAVRCRRCTHGFPEHEDAGGHCRQVVAGVMPCPCPGMQWIDPGGPAIGSYTDPPAF
jgi:hypothetical protein